MAPAPGKPPRDFPVWLSDADRLTLPTCPESIPWDMLRPLAARVRRNHKGRGLDDLSRAGGLDPVELLAVLDDRPFPVREAKADLHGLKQRAAAELLRRVVRFTGGRGANAVALRPALVFDCPLCHAENVVPVQPVAAVTCKFCSTTYAVGGGDGPTGDDGPGPGAIADAPPGQHDGPPGTRGDGRPGDAAAGRERPAFTHCG